MDIPVYDTATEKNQVAATSTSWSHTCSGTDRILIVSALMGINLTGLSITYNGVAMTQFATEQTNGKKMATYYLVNPSSGINTISASWTTSQATRWIGYSATGVNSGTPLGTPVTSAGSGTAPNVDIGSNTDELGVGFAGVGGTTSVTFTAGTGDNLRIQAPPGANNGFMACLDTTGTSPTVNIRANTNASVTWEIIGVSLKPVSPSNFFMFF
ncbi:MAG: hypothetical protein WA061_02410 [Microgenomates group bacterium]